MRRQQLADRFVEPAIGDGVGAAFHHVLLDRPSRDPLRERRHPEDPHLRVGRPRQPGLPVLFDPGNVFRFDADRPGHEHISGSEPQQIVGLRADVCPVDAVAAVAPDNQQTGLDLGDPLHHHLERLADQDLGDEGNVGELLRHHFGPLQIRLRQLEEALVDDVVVQLFLLLELEDFRGAFGEHVLDVAEDGVVVFDVEGAAGVERRAEGPRQLESQAHRAVAVR